MREMRKKEGGEGETDRHTERMRGMRKKERERKLRERNIIE